jgi:hypothetical protein
MITKIYCQKYNETICSLDRCHDCTCDDYKSSAKEQKKFKEIREDMQAVTNRQPTEQQALDLKKTFLEQKGWIRYKDQKPPLFEHVLVLVNGEVHEGFLDSYVIMGNTEPTVFKTLMTNSHGPCGSAQHTSWGDDPYWLPMPFPKPKQVRKKREKCDEMMAYNDED